jgi:hypothetical protein
MASVADLAARDEADGAVAVGFLADDGEALTGEGLAGGAVGVAGLEPAQPGVGVAQDVAVDPGLVGAVGLALEADVGAAAGPRAADDDVAAWPWAEP